MKLLKLFPLLLLLCSACSSDDKEADKVPKPDIRFERTKWQAGDNGTYTYRKQMINDLLSNYKWEGITRDSLVQMLGEPDDIEADIMMIYYYERKRKAGGVMFSHKSITFELTADKRQVKSAKRSEGLEWN